MRRCAYEYVSASEPTLTNPSEILRGIKGPRTGKSTGPNGKSNRVLRHLLMRKTSSHTKEYNAVRCRQYFSPAWKHACIVAGNRKRPQASFFLETRKSTWRCLQTPWDHTH
jgi:hypothetical protein